MQTKFSGSWIVCQQVSIQLVKEKSVKYKRVCRAQDVINVAKSVIGNADREYGIVLCLDARGKITAVNTASIGTLNAAYVHPREIFKPAILSNTDRIIFVHNHPSGDFHPSESDNEITKRLREAGKILGIPLIDSVIIGDDGYYSFADEQNWREAPDG